MQINQIQNFAQTGLASFRGTVNLKQSFAQNPLINFKGQNKDTVDFKHKKPEILIGSLPDNLAETISDIIKNPNDYKPYGKGGTANVYKIQANNKTYAIKIANDKHNTEMADGAAILEKLPEKMKKGGQKLYAYGKLNGREFLVTNLVHGTSDKPAVSKEQLKSLLMDNILELDKAGIMHNDLWMPNIMVDKNSVNLIDYDYAKMFNPLTSSDNRVPGNISLNSNLFDFEMLGLETYINYLDKTNTGEAKVFFKNYLEVKSEFHKKRAEFLENALKKEKTLTPKDIKRVKNSIEYEKALSAVFKNPDDDIMDLEAKRVQMLYSFNWANKNAHFKKPTDAAQCWMRTVIYAKQYEDSVISLSQTSDDENMQKYLGFQKEYAKFYTDTFAKWGKDTINWLFDVFSSRKPLSDYDKEVYQNGIENPISQLHQGFKQYDDISDLYDIIMK